MPGRLRVFDMRASRFPRVLGLCQDDLPEICAALDSAQARLLYAKEAGEESWHGTFAEVGFELSAATPYITLPREIARLEGSTVCDSPIAISNQFIHYLQFGNGRLRQNRHCNGAGLQAVSLNNAVTFVDMTAPPNYLRMYISDARDIGKRVLLQGKDGNGVVIYSTDNLNEVTGIFVPLNQPFAVSPLTFGTITGIQKDVTYGPVEFYQVNPDTGADVLLLTMQPGETTADYRRYYFNSLSNNTTQIISLAKLDLLPVKVDTDYLVIQNREALILEAQSMKYSESDSPTAKQLAAESHQQAIRLLMGESGHFSGIRSPAVNFAPFGSARLERVNIGMQ